MALQRQSFAGSRGRQPKRIVIKNFTAPTARSSELQEADWAALSSAVSAIFGQQETQATLQSLSAMVRSACASQHSAALYQRLRTVLESHVGETAARLASQSSPSDDETLQLFHRTWTDHCNHMRLIQSIFVDLDRVYALKNESVPQLWDLALELFRDHVFQKTQLMPRLIDALLNSIERERRGEAVNRNRVKHLLAMLLALRLYDKAFEPRFLQTSSDFFRAEGGRLIMDLAPGLYLDHTSKRLREEQDRVRLYLDESTHRPLIAIVEAHLLSDHLETLLSNGFPAMLERLEESSIKLLGQLIARIGKTLQLRDAFIEAVKVKGAEYVMNPEKDRDMVDDLLAYKAKIDSVVQHSFNMDSLFINAVKTAFEGFINKRNNKPAEMLAKYIDGKLRTGYKECTEDELDRLMDRVLVLFRFINGKDVFEAFYKNHLSKRLLYGKSASIDLEKSMLAKLKQECGANFTSNLEGMFKDMSISEELTSSFKQHLKSRDEDHTIELNVNVLTQSYWPGFPNVTINLPREMTYMQDQFKQFYINKHQNRRLMWQNSQGHCLLHAKFPKGSKDLQLSLYQAVVMMLFNQHKILTYEQIAQMTAIPSDELKRTLQSMALGKVRVMAKNPKTKEVSEDDKFAVNEKFSNPHKRVKVNQIQLKETTEENAATNEKVFQDRVYAVDAAIVRVMKTRKTLKHSLLMNELFEQLKFPVKPSDLKKRIESLIDREYLERDEKDPQTYNYLA